MNAVRRHAEQVSGAENGPEWVENRVSWSGAVSGHSRKRLSGNGAWNWAGRPRSRSRAESGLNRPLTESADT